MRITDEAILKAAKWLYEGCDVDVAEFGLYGEVRGESEMHKKRLMPFRHAVEMVLRESEVENGKA